MGSTENTARSLVGCLRLRFAYAKGRTILTDAVRAPPFHVQRLLYLDRCWPDLAQAAVLNTTAGMFSGDRLELAVDVASHASVELTTPTSTRVFAMDDGCAESRTSIAVAPGGYLEFVSRPVILCRDAALRLRTSVTVGRGGRAAVGEVLAFGRAAAGERHCYRWLDQRTELRYDGNIALTEALRIAREDGPDAVGVLGDAAVYGALHLLGVDSEMSSFVTQVRQMIDAQRHVMGGVSTLHGDASIAVRLLGSRPHAVYEALRLVALEFRQGLQRSPCH
ncbi:MAG: urease accessory protein UreD [Dehalococcoidia bacterium]